MDSGIYREADRVLEGRGAELTDKTAKLPTIAYDNMQTAYNSVQNTNFRGFVSKIPSETPGNDPPASTDWTAEDWRAFFEERAAIAEYDGGLSRADAEAQALRCSVVAWMNANPVKSDPDRCAHCGQPEAGGAQVIPFGSGPVWLHPECWREWQSRQERDAVHQLRMSGIPLKADVGDGG